METATYSVPWHVNSPVVKQGLRSVDEADALSEEPSVFTGLAWMGVAALGGAATGYVSSGDGRGALTGACVHTTLVGLSATVAARNTMAPWKTAVYGLVALASGVGAGYLFYQRKHRRRR